MSNGSEHLTRIGVEESTTLQVVTRQRQAFRRYRARRPYRSGTCPDGSRLRAMRGAIANRDRGEIVRAVRLRALGRADAARQRESGRWRHSPPAALWLAAPAAFGQLPAAHRGYTGSSSVIAEFAWSQSVPPHAAFGD